MSSSPTNSPTNNSNASNILPPLDNTITTFTLNETIVDNSTQVVNQQGTTDSGNEVTRTEFTTTLQSSDAQITQHLEEVVSAYYDDAQSGPNQVLIATIQNYASQIKCENFHGKGSIDDYQSLFVSASKIANDAKQMTLDIDVEGFNEFASAADSLSALFNSFIVKLQNVSIINDTVFLTSIANALAKIVNLSVTFGKFKETIVATSSVQLPKSAHDTKVVLESVASELNCAMNYINYFVDSSAPKPLNANLSNDEQNVITKAVSAIDNWVVLCDQGVSIALSNNSDIQFINLVNNDLKNKTNALKTATSKLQAKLALYQL